MIKRTEVLNCGIANTNIKQKYLASILYLASITYFTGRGNSREIITK